MKETSSVAYARAEASGFISAARLKTLRLVCEHGPCSASQLEVAAVESGICGDRDAYSLHKRLSELERQGVVRGDKVAPCPITGNAVTIWEATEQPPVPLPASSASTRVLNKRVESLERQLADADDALADARGEALVMRRTLEWLRYKCDDVDIGKCVACNALDYLGYTEMTDDCEVDDIFNPNVRMTTTTYGLGVGGKAK